MQIPSWTVLGVCVLIGAMLFGGGWLGGSCNKPAPVVTTISVHDTIPPVSHVIDSLEAVLHEVTTQVGVERKHSKDWIARADALQRLVDSMRDSVKPEIQNVIAKLDTSFYDPKKIADERLDDVKKEHLQLTFDVGRWQWRDLKLETPTYVIRIPVEVQVPGPVRVVTQTPIPWHWILAAGGATGGAAAGTPWPGIVAIIVAGGYEILK